MGSRPEAKERSPHHQSGPDIRKTSLDELPQLWNVLMGEMSIVGPRPMMINQRRMYPDKHYFALRPGITGAWQVSSRNDSSFAERATFDADYNRCLSLREDLRIIKATFGVVLKGTSLPPTAQTDKIHKSVGLACDQCLAFLCALCTECPHKTGQNRHMRGPLRIGLSRAVLVL